MRKALLLVLVAAGLLAAMAGTRWLTQPPPVRVENAPGQFDAVRARARLATIIGPSPAHPADSASSDGVRGRLVAELRAAGLSPRVEDRFACNKLRNASGASCARVRNVLVTVGPEASAPHILVNTHYDSVPVGPGASDAGLGVAAMIEAAGLLKDRPLARQVTFLFNEGEELGLIGARAFLDGDPLSRRVDALINLEARGTSGPVNMFETSVPNAAAVSIFRQSVGRPVANSLAVSAYRLIPNRTDVNTFAEERRWLTLNFAPIGNETRYHSPGDDLSAVDLSTLQHMGDQLMATAAKLGSGATPDQWQRGRETLFMNVGTRWLLTIPIGMALGGLVGFAIGWWLRRWKADVPPPLRPVLTALPLMLAAVLASAALGYAGLGLVGTLREGQFWRAFPKAAELALYAGVIAAGLAMLSLTRRWSLQALRRAWWLFFLAFGLVLAVFARGALVYFLVPPLLFLFGVELQRRWRYGELAGALAAALFTFVTLGAMLGLLQDLLNSGPLWVFAIIGALVLMPWLIEARPLVEGPGWRRVVPAALAFAALAWVPAALVPAYSADRQQQWTTQYVLQEGKPPVWSIVNDRKPLPAEFDRLGEWRQGQLPLGARQRWIAAAPVQPGFAPPALKKVGEVPIVTSPTSTAATRPGRRTGRMVRLRLRTNGAHSVVLIVEKAGALAAAGFNDRRMVFESGTSPPYSLTCTGRSCDGAVAELATGMQALDVSVVATHWRLPPAAAALLAARPEWARPQYLPDATIMVRRIRI
jgi:hypothetical protein